MIEKVIEVERMEHVISVFGSFDQNLRLIEEELEVKVIDRDNRIHICGEPEAVMHALQPKENPSKPKLWDRRTTAIRFDTIPSHWASDRQEPVRPIWRWRLRWQPSEPRRSTASSSHGLQ